MMDQPPKDQEYYIMKNSNAISQFSTKREVQPNWNDIQRLQTENSEGCSSNFAVKSLDAKSALKPIIKILIREIRKHKLNYSQLAYCFKEARSECGLKAPSKAKTLFQLPTKQELREFMGSINNPLHFLLFEFLLLTGLRISEATNLKVNHVDLESNMVFVKEGKGKRDRVVPLSSNLSRKIAVYLQGKSNEYLFESRRNTKFTPRRVEQLCAIYRKKSGIETPLHPHVLRHCFITMLAEKGLSADIRAAVAGHADVATQKTYTHLSLEGIKDKVVEAIDQFKLT